MKKVTTQCPDPHTGPLPSKGDPERCSRSMTPYRVSSPLMLHELHVNTLISTTLISLQPEPHPDQNLYLPLHPLVGCLMYIPPDALSDRKQQRLVDTGLKAEYDACLSKFQSEGSETQVFFCSQDIHQPSPTPCATHKLYPKSHQSIPSPPPPLQVPPLVFWAWNMKGYL